MNENPHRGPLLHIRGWLEYPESSVESVKEILDGMVNRAGEFSVTKKYIKEINKAWTLPELQIPEEQRYIMWSYLFIGAYLHISCEAVFKAEVESFAKLYEWSGPLKIWMNGEIQIEDDAGKWAKSWLIDEGNLKESLLDNMG